MELVLLIVFRNNNLDDYGNLRMITRTDPMIHRWNYSQYPINYYKVNK